MFIHWMKAVHPAHLKKAAAFALTMALTTAYLVSPTTEINAVYAETSQNSQITITAQPADVTVKTGETARFSVQAQGTNLSYQWYYKKSGASDWSVWKGHTTATTYATANSTWNMMRVCCVIMNGSTSVLSEEAVIRVNQPLTVTSQPDDVTAKSGATVKFSVAAQGFGKLSYQWYYKKDGASVWSIWKGHTTATISATANDTWNLMQVYCRITDSAGASVDSRAAVIKLQRALTILTPPQDMTVKAGATVKFSVAAQGCGKLSYQWYYRKQGESAWSVWSGQTSAETNAQAVSGWNLMQVHCRVTDEAGKIARSAMATLTIDQPITIITQPKDALVKPGKEVKFTVVAQGTGECSYQWFTRRPGEVSWSPWNGYTAPEVMLAAEEILDGTEFYCRVTDAKGARKNTVSAKLIILPDMKISQQPAGGTYHTGDTATFSIGASGYGSLKYQWYYRKAGKSTWTLWSGKTSSSVTASADCTWHYMEVYCRVTDEAGQIIDSDKAQLFITKKSDTRYIKRTFTVKSNGTKIYSGPGTNYSSIGTLKAGAKYLALEWSWDSSDNTWYRFNWGGKTAWILRSKTNVSDEFVTIPDRSFKDGGLPVIYLSPSRQTSNEYAAGSTTEGVQMYRVGNELKKILEEEYWCIVYMPPVEMPISLGHRPLDAYNKEADIYLAIHSNAHTSKVKYGAVGYYFPGSAQSKKLGENMADEMGKISPFTPNVDSKIVDGMKGFDNVGYGEVRDPAYYGMISLLAEVEYHDNADSAQWIINNPKSIARALANSLEKTFDIQKK
jgi:N-acetylmuramoyl-L-alanine amidase